MNELHGEERLREGVAQDEKKDVNVAGGREAGSRCSQEEVTEATELCELLGERTFYIQ